MPTKAGGFACPTNMFVAVARATVLWSSQHVSLLWRPLALS
jgi:hypothetical protein